MVSCALWEFEEALRWVILNNALAPLVHYSELPTLAPLQILHNALFIAPISNTFYNSPK